MQIVKCTWLTICIIRGCISYIGVAKGKKQHFFGFSNTDQLTPHLSAPRVPAGGPQGFSPQPQAGMANGIVPKAQKPALPPARTTGRWGSARTSRRPSSGASCWPCWPPPSTWSTSTPGCPKCRAPGGGRGSATTSWSCGAYTALS